MTSTTYRLMSQCTNNANLDCSTGGGGIFYTLDEAMAAAQNEAEFYGCKRVPERETGDVVFYAEAFTPWPKSIKRERPHRNLIPHPNDRRVHCPPPLPRTNFFPNYAAAYMKEARVLIVHR